MSQIRRITFKPNDAGYQHIDVNTASWEIVGGSGTTQAFIGKACRLDRRGQHVEYRGSDGKFVQMRPLIETIK